MRPTLGSLFAGIGGFDLGFERAGFKTIWQCEIDKAAQGVLRRHFPHAKLHSDVREVGALNLEPVDVITFGSPCQDLSVAGKRAGLAGDRSGLFHEATRIIRELRQRYGKPDFAIWENVPGAFSSRGGADFAAVVQTMVNLGARDVCWRVLDSRYFGVAQRRRRVFLVADFGGERAEQVLFEPESLRGDSKKGGAKRKEAARDAGAGAAGGGGEWPARVTSTLNTAYGTKMGLEDQHALAGASMFVPAQPIPFDTTQLTSPSNYSSPKPGDPCHPLAAGAHPIAFQPGNLLRSAGAAPATDVFPTLKADHGRGRSDQFPHIAQAVEPITVQASTVCATGAITHALTCTAQQGATEDGSGRGVPRAAHLTPMRVRRLTPIECESLQGFPRNWTAEAHLPDGTLKPQADGPRYKQLGNAVTVNVAEWIAKRLANAVDHFDAKVIDKEV